MEPEIRQQQLVRCLNGIDKVYHPNANAILSLLVTFSVGSCSCERSFNAFSRLKTWSRISMGKNRLNGLAMDHVHKDQPLVEGQH